MLEIDIYLHYDKFILKCDNNPQNPSVVRTPTRMFLEIYSLWIFFSKIDFYNIKKEKKITIEGDNIDLCLVR